MKLINDLLNKVLSNSIEITMKMDEEGQVWYDLNVRAKSGLSIKCNEDGSVTARGRYNYITLVEDWDDLLCEVA